MREKTDRPASNHARNGSCVIHEDTKTQSFRMIRLYIKIPVTYGAGTQNIVFDEMDKTNCGYSEESTTILKKKRI